VSFEEGLFYYLDNYPGLSAEVDDRIYPAVLPPTPEYPAVTYNRISTPRLAQLENLFLPHARFQFDCWAEEFSRAKDVAEQVRLALDLYSGPMGAYTAHICIIDDEIDTYEAETEIWHSIVDVIIWYLE